MDTQALISSWEAVLAQPPAARAAWLAAAFRQAGGEACDAVGTASGVHPCDVDVGQRERETLQLLAMLSGDSFEASTVCAHCSESMEFAIALSAFDIAPAAAHEVREGAWEIVLRVPDTRDVIAALASADSDADLFARCVVSARHAGEALCALDLPQALRDRCEAQLDALAPLANATLDLRCPACGTADTTPLDFGAFAFEYTRHWIEDLLDEIAQLCRAYGWREADALTMSAWRRRFYLARVEVP